MAKKKTGYVITDTGVVDLFSTHDDKTAFFVNQPPPPQPRGAPTQKDWQGALISVIARVDKEGLPPPEHGAQAKVARWMVEWLNLNTDKRPSDSQLKEVARQIYKERGKGQ